MEPTVGIMVLNHNGKAWLPGLYRSLLADSYPEKRIYLVDNHSDDGSYEMTLSSYPEIKILRLSENLGYSTAYNLTMRFAIADGCDYVIWANSDVLIESSCLAQLVKVASTDPRIGVVGPSLLAWKSEEPNEFIFGNYPSVIPAMKARSEQPLDVDWVEGSFPMVNKECIDTIGGLDPYLHMGWEDADFCRRARFRGWRVVLAPAARVHHYSGGWTNASAQNKAYHLGTKARNYYIYKLTNPYQSFSMNVVNAGHLFLVNMRALLPQSSQNAIAETKIFLNVLREWRLSRAKWRRDRARKPPPRLREGDLSVQINVTQGKGSDTHDTIPMH